MKYKSTLPNEMTLPSGRRVHLSDSSARAAARASERRRDSLALAVLILDAPGVLTDTRGGRLSPGSLSMDDAQVLRVFLIRARILRERARDYVCENCDAAFRVAPTSAWEAAPFVDSELDDPELDEALDYERDHEISGVRVGRQVARTVRLSPRTVEEAEPFWRAASSRRLEALPDGLTPSLVTAMGLAALGNERRMSKILPALTSASEEAWADVVDIVNDAHYSPRLVAPHRCARCGARNFLDVPAARELLRIGRPRGFRTSRFMPLDRFEEIVRQSARKVYRRRGVKNIPLWIDDGVPLCDDAGEPLLGCYTPPGTDQLISSREEPEIRIFYRSFQTEFRGAPEREVEREIHETIDHEVTHHLHFLSGVDPLDDAEQDEIFQENRRMIGRAETSRRAVRGAIGNVLGFLRAAWPLLLLGLVLSVFAYCR